MGIFGFVENILTAGVKVVVTPLTVVKDIVEGEPLTTTGAVLESAKDDVEDAFDAIDCLFLPNFQGTIGAVAKTEEGFRVDGNLSPKDMAMSEAVEHKFKSNKRVEKIKSMIKNKKNK